MRYRLYVNKLELKIKKNSLQTLTEALTPRLICWKVLIQSPVIQPNILVSETEKFSYKNKQDCEPFSTLAILSAHFAKLLKLPSSPKAANLV
jgi:hypothetical protein